MHSKSSNGAPQRMLHRMGFAEKPLWVRYNALVTFLSNAAVEAREVYYSTVRRLARESCSCAVHAAAIVHAKEGKNLRSRSFTLH